MLLVWFRERVWAACGFTSFNRTYCDVLSYAVLKEGVPENKDLEGLAQKIVAEWKELGRRLLKSEAEEELYAIDKQNDKYSEKAYKMLLKWKQAQGSGATFRVLHDALRDPLVNRRDLAEKYCGQCSVTNDSVAHKCHTV